MLDTLATHNISATHKHLALMDYIGGSEHRSATHKHVALMALMETSRTAHISLVTLATHNHVLPPRRVLGLAAAFECRPHDQAPCDASSAGSGAAAMWSRGLPRAVVPAHRASVARFSHACVVRLSHYIVELRSPDESRTFSVSLIT